MGDLGSIPGSERSPGEGNGNPLQYSCLENPMDRGAGQATVHGVSESDTTERLSTAQQKEGVGFVRDGGYTSECTRQDPSYYTLKLRGFYFLHLKKKKKKK